MTEAQIRTQYEARKPALEAFGNYVRDTLTSRLEKHIQERGFGQFIKIPVQPRVKETKSLIEKIFVRQKPYAGITDLVGVRYVLLLNEDIKLVSDEIEAEDSWIASRDRDFDEERRKDPLVFGYQSVHYVVCLRHNVVHDGVDIPEQTPCEIQVRTLLQHAVSELTHDQVYKAPIAVRDPIIHRTIAKSTALVEATGDFFNEAAQKLIDVRKHLSNIIEWLTSAYAGFDQKAYAERLNFFVLDSLQNYLTEVDSDKIKSFLEEKSYIMERIDERKNDYLLFAQPVILLLYFLISKHEINLLNDLPLPKNVLNLIYSDLGIAMDPLG